MAIVSLKAQAVTVYDADGWILRAPVSTGTTGRETPAGIFAVVEKDKTFGGTCLNVGCIPSKALLHAAQIVDRVVVDLGVRARLPGVLAQVLPVDDDLVHTRGHGVADDLGACREQGQYEGVAHSRDATRRVCAVRPAPDKGFHARGLPAG